MVAVVAVAVVAAAIMVFVLKNTVLYLNE